MSDVSRIPTAPNAVLVLVAAILTAPLGAQQTGIAAHVGTLGLGADLAVQVGPRLSLRGGFNFFPFDVDARTDDVDFTVRLPSPQYLLLADYYPVGRFRLSGGVLISPSDLTATGTPTRSVEIGDHSYTPQEVGTLRGEVSAHEVAPYVGIGFGDPTRSGFGFFLDVGVAFHGTPALTASADGAAASWPGFQDDLDAEIADRQDDVDYAVVYPVLSLGVSIRVSGSGRLAAR